METVTIPVRTALMPLCYKDFHCLAAACRDNCCGGWEIAFGKKDYLRIKRSAQSEELKEILSKGMSRLRGHELGDQFYARFAVGAEGVCPFQNEDGLCRLQLECGSEALPEVCRAYPRRTFYTSAAKEFALSPSCEAVLALLWDLPQGIDFWEEDLPTKDWGTVKTEPRLARFADIRSFCVDVLQERSLPFSRRMLLLGMLVRRLTESDWTGEGDVDRWLALGEEQLRAPSTASVLDGTPRDRDGYLAGNFYTLLELYKTTGIKEKAVYHSLISALSANGEDWEHSESEQFDLDRGKYWRLERRLEDLLGHSDYFFENLMVITAFYQTFPTLVTPEKLWRSYVGLCGLYSFFRFAAICGCGVEASRERLFQVIGTVSRGLLHNAWRLDSLTDAILEDGGTLERIAVLTGG